MNFTRIHEAEKKIYNTYIRFAKNYGLSYGQLAVIASLSEGPSRQKDICDLWQITKQTLNTICTNYIKEGWLEMIADPQDKRSKLLSFTPLGKKEAEPIANKLREIEQKVFQQFSTEELEWYERTSVKFANLMEEEVNRV